MVSATVHGPLTLMTLMLLLSKHSKGICKLTTSMYYHHLMICHWLSQQHHHFVGVSQQYLHLTLLEWLSPYDMYTLSPRIHHKAVSSDGFHSVFSLGRGYCHLHFSSLYKLHPKKKSRSRCTIATHTVIWNLAYSYAKLHFGAMIVWSYYITEGMCSTSIIYIRKKNVKFSHPSFLKAYVTGHHWYVLSSSIEDITPPVTELFPWSKTNLK